MKDNKIRIVICMRGMPATLGDVENDLEAMQALVGGYIEVMPLSGGVVLVCNEEGKIDGSKPNRELKMRDGTLLDTIRGTFFLCRTEGEEFASLEDADVKKLLLQFRDRTTAIL